MVYIQIKMFFLHGPTEFFSVGIAIQCITLFCSECYKTSHNIHLTQYMYIDKTYSVKQMCASVLLKINIKLFLGIKHITQTKQYAIRRQTNECKHIFPYFFLNSNLILKKAMPVLLILIVSFFHGHVKYTIFKDKLSKINKAIFVHNLIKTPNKLS